MQICTLIFLDAPPLQNPFIKKDWRSFSILAIHRMMMIFMMMITTLVMITMMMMMMMMMMMLMMVLTPMMELSSLMVTCFALSTAVTTCCWCWKGKESIVIWIYIWNCISQKESHLHGFYTQWDVNPSSDEILLNQLVSTYADIIITINQKLRVNWFLIWRFFGRIDQYLFFFFFGVDKLAVVCLWLEKLFVARQCTAGAG